MKATYFQILDSLFFLLVINLLHISLIFYSMKKFKIFDFFLILKIICIYIYLLILDRNKILKKLTFNTIKYYLILSFI